MWWNGPLQQHRSARTWSLLERHKGGTVPAKQVSTIGLDLAKHVFQVHGADAEGSPVFNRKLRRSGVLRFFEKLPRCLVGMEACGSAHYWAREIAALGHEVRLIPFRADQDGRAAGCRNGAEDPRASGPAADTSGQRPARASGRIGHHRHGRPCKVEALVAIVRDETDARLPAAARFALRVIADEIEASANQIDRLERAIVVEAKHDEDMRRLTTIPGVGPLRRRPSRRSCRIPAGSSRLATLPPG
ncbi:transposase [Bradyrhizobium yuanmingense]|uniref:Transposase n=1 Tax=Bradyrhizobium yuanmingense TaxID=108015 RepID=A0ABV4G8R9_9BRAD